MKKFLLSKNGKIKYDAFFVIIFFTTILSLIYIFCFDEDEELNSLIAFYCIIIFGVLYTKTLLLIHKYILQSYSAIELIKKFNHYYFKDKIKFILIYNRNQSSYDFTIYDYFNCQDEYNSYVKGRLEKIKKIRNNKYLEKNYENFFD